MVYVGYINREIMSKKELEVLILSGLYFGVIGEEGIIL